MDIGFGQGLTLWLAANEGAAAEGIDVNEGCLEAFDLTSRYFPDTPRPRVRIASILDEGFVSECTPYDVVYSWGVLHHTGDMEGGIRNAVRLVAPNGYLVISIYNRHWSSPLWRIVKKYYNLFPGAAQKCLVAFFYPIIMSAKFLVTGQNPFRKERGMDFHHDVVDWLGGYPYEYAAPRRIIELCESLGMRLRTLRKAQVPTGCNEFVFQASGA